VVLVEPGVVRDMAAALTGFWDPSLEDHPERAEELVAAARLRLYGDRDRSGWLLVVTGQGHASAAKRGDADWSVGMLPVAEDFDDAPPPGEVDALVAQYRREQGLDAEAARTLALAVLFEPVDLLVCRLPRVFRHERRGDLPARLTLLDVFEAVERLGIARGEKPILSLPIGSALESAEPWWVPS
jgi:hypothetical protein